MDDPFVVRYPEIQVVGNWHFSKLMQQSGSVAVEHEYENEIPTMLHNAGIPYEIKHAWTLS